MSGRSQKPSNPQNEEKSIALDLDDDVCVVCFRKMEIFSVGECDHPVCFECSTRMRVLCKQNECPICRQDLAKVILTRQVASYQHLDNKVRSGLFDKKYRVCFADYYEQAAFFDLLEHKCPKCDVRPLGNFSLLKDHVRKEHEMFYCDICTENLKIFSAERRCYNRQQLAVHRRKGDPDDSSHRGHPLCKYCDFRYLDRDELFRHLRREHFFCHFCDADGANQFYSDYPALRDHFKAEHYLCEEGDCQTEQFTAAFRTDIDLKAHRMKIHGNSMGKIAFKQTRTLELEFTLAPRNRMNQQGENSRGGGGGRRRHYDTQMEFEAANEEVLQQNNPPPQMKIDARSDQEFPALGGDNKKNLSLVGGTIREISTFIGQSNFTKSKENFPALGGAMSSAATSSGFESDKGGGGAGKSVYSKMTASNMLKNSSKSRSGAAPSSSRMVIHVSNRPQQLNSTSGKMAASDFPALGGGSKNKHIYDDLPPMAAGGGANMGSMPSKYRDSVNTYESVAAAAPPKVTLIKKTNNTTSKSTQKPAVPKLDLSENFPSFPALSGSKNKNIFEDSSFSMPSKYRDSVSSYESVAAAKVTKKTNSTASKPPTQKPVVPKPDFSDNFPTLGGSKNKRSMYDDLTPAMGGTSSVNMSSMPSKYRDSVNTYESVAASAPPKVGLFKKTDETSTKPTQKSAVPKLDLPDNFPSLGKSKQPTSVPAAWVTAAAKNNQTRDRKSKVAPAPDLKTVVAAPKNGNTDKSTNNNSKKGANNININNNNNQSNGNKANQSEKDKKKTGNKKEQSETNQSETNKENGVHELVNAPANSDNDKRVAPPGFNKPMSGAPAPPPGFSVFVNSVAKNTHNLTFTSSLGEKFDIFPQNNCSFSPPGNAIKRNQALVKSFQSVLNNDGMTQFRELSQLFREGKCFAKSYYEHVRVALGEEGFEEIFPELLVLLPDITKQQELFLVHSQCLKENTKQKKKSKLYQLEVCPTCKQVLISSDVASHCESHMLENNFPVLGKDKNNTTSLPKKQSTLK